MKIQTNHIPHDGLDLVFEEMPGRFASVQALVESGECSFSSLVKISLEVTPMPDMFCVNGRIEAMAGLVCARCLESFDHRLSNSFTLFYSQTIPDDLHSCKDDSIELTAQQMDLMHYQGDEIDFTDAIQEQILLAIPSKPLCSDECKGLCAQCGRNLNVDQCQCRDQIANGPFEVLKQLKRPSE